MKRATRIGAPVAGGEQARKARGQLFEIAYIYTEKR